MAKKSGRQQRETRRQISRREREARQARNLYIGLGGIAALIVLVLIYSLLLEPIRLGGETIATVNGTPIYVRDFQPRVRYEATLIQLQINNIISTLQQLGQDPALASFRSQYQQQLSQQQSRLQTVGPDTLAIMVDDELVRQEAQKRSLTITDEEIDREVELDLKAGLGYPRPSPTPTEGPSPTATSPPTLTPIPTPTLTPTLLPSPTATLSATLAPTPTEFPTGTPEPTQTPLSPDAYRQKLDEFKGNLAKVNVSFEDYRHIVTTRLVRSKLRLALANNVLTTGEQVRARHILVKDFTDAISVTNQLNAGADFAELAKKVSLDTVSGKEAGDLGWALRGVYVKEFDEAIFTLPINQTSLVTTTFGVHVIQVLERDANRELNGEQLDTRRASALDDWLKETRGKADIKRSYKPDYLPSEIRRALGTR